MSKERIMVMMGGSSTEREVSLRSGAAVLEALQQEGYVAQGLDFQLETLEANIAQLKEFAPELVFLALHGKYGEDGTVQGLLELLHIPYVGSGVAASAVCMDKLMSKRYIAAAGFPTPDYRHLEREILQRPPQLERALAEAERDFGWPLVVKAACQGSSIGTYIVDNAATLRQAVEDAFAYDEHVLLEQFVRGTELTVPVIGNHQPHALPIIEITANNKFYDYEAKYTAGMCQHIIPARILSETAELVQSISCRLYSYLHCRGFARVDFMLDAAGQPWILEVNTIPGMTDMSLVPDAARAEGLSFNALVAQLVQWELADRNKTECKQDFSA